MLPPNFLNIFLPCCRIPLGCVPLNGVNPLLPRAVLLKFDVIFDFLNIPPRNFDILLKAK